MCSILTNQNCRRLSSCIFAGTDQSDSICLMTDGITRRAVGALREE
jgi:hypothetical protein